MAMKSTILIVDDEPFGRAMLAALLKQADYEIVLARDGGDALALANQQPPDLVLLDVMMPDMDGFAVCEQLRATPALADVPIILLTALNDEESRLRGIRAGADDFISKPFNRDELRARVRTITRLNRYRRLLAERTKFEWVAEHASEGYVLLDAANQITYANQRARLYLHLPLTDLLPPLNFFELACRWYHPQPAEAWNGADGDASASPYYLIQPETATAPAFWLQVVFLAVPGTPAMRLARLSDVTEKMSLRYDRAGFREMLLHKLRTPSMVFLSSLELLQRNTNRFTPTELAELAQDMYASALRLHRQVEQVLDYFRAPALAQAGEGCTLAQVLEDAEQFGAALEIAALQVTAPTEARAARLTLSRQALNVVLWEILQNAKKFHPRETPTVQITALLTSDHPGTAVALSIADDGVTLSPQQLARAWIPYYQGEKFFTGQVEGMGLGLATVAALVWAAGGACRMLNRENAPGVIVELRLPVEAGTA